MRILNVISSTDPAHGGPIEWIRQFGTAAVAQGHRVDVVSMDPPQAPWVADFPLPIHAVGSILRGFHAPSLVPWLRSNAATFDCVIAHGLWRYPSFGTWRALRQSSTPYFVYTHGMLDPWFRDHYPLKHVAKSLYWPFTDYRALRDACSVIFTCEQERKKAAETMRPYRLREMVATLGITSPTGDPEAQRERFFTEFPETRRRRNILFLGRIHPKKGCDLLIEAFPTLLAQDPDFHLIVAGPDHTNWRPHLRQLVQQRGIGDRVTWIDMISGDLKWGAYHAAEAFALPSHQENFGITVVEAMACGVPVLISENVDIFQEISDGGAGFTAPDTAAGTIDLLSRWGGTSATLRREMRRNALSCFHTHFEVGKATKNLIGLLENRIAEEAKTA